MLDIAMSQIGRADDAAALRRRGITSHARAIYLVAERRFTPGHDWPKDAGRMQLLRRHGRPGNASCCIATVSPPEPKPAERSSRGSTATTHAAVLWGPGIFARCCVETLFDGLCNRY